MIVSFGPTLRSKESDLKLMREQGGRETDERAERGGGGKRGREDGGVEVGGGAEHVIGDVSAQRAHSSNVAVSV